MVSVSSAAAVARACSIESGREVEISGDGVASGTTAVGNATGVAALSEVAVADGVAIDFSSVAVGPLPIAVAASVPEAGSEKISGDARQAVRAIPTNNNENNKRIGANCTWPPAFLKHRGTLFSRFLLCRGTIGDMLSLDRQNYWREHYRTEYPGW